jgi:hypothetical protein
MKDLFSSQPDVSSPINSNGAYGNASGTPSLKRTLKRKPTQRDEDKRKLDKGPPKGDKEDDDANSRYFGSFSIESKRHVWDLLDKHPKFEQKGAVRTSRIDNNTRDVLKNDPQKLIENGGKVTYS